MSKNKKRNLQFTERSKEDNPNYVASEICVWCGKKLDPDTHKRRYMDISRMFYPVCDAECEQAVRGFVAKDHKFKSVVYITLFVAVVLMFASSFVEWRDVVLAPCLITVGVVFLAFPYPFSNPQTFTMLPMKRSKIVCRLIGIVLLAVGIPLFSQALSAWWVI